MCYCVHIISPNVCMKMTLIYSASPSSSPSRQRTIADPTTRRSNTPPRPPPPKFPSMNKQASLNVESQQAPVKDVSVSPPASPMRRRTMDMDKNERPKPPVRRRKKFQTPGDETKRRSSLEEADEGNGTAMSTAESHDQVNGNAPEQRTSSEDAGGVDRVVEGGNSANQNAENRFDDGSEEGWEVIPNISISAEQIQNELQKQRGSLKKQKSEESSPILRVGSSSSPDQSRSPSFSKKKRPPPFRPAPYTPKTPKTPPIPTKKRKAVTIKEPAGVRWNKLAEEASKVARPDGPSPMSTPEPEEHRQQQQQQEGEQEFVGGHVYEAVEPFHVSTPLTLVENGHNKHLGSSSSESSVSSTLTRSSSVGNVNNVGSGEGSSKQSGTLSLTNFHVHGVGRQDNGKKQRPKSEAVVSSVKDFETSFEVSSIYDNFGVVLESLLL